MSRRRVRVPATVWSQLGPVPVRLTTPVLGDDGEPLCGSYDADARVIEVDSTMAPVVQMQRAPHSPAPTPLWRSAPVAAMPVSLASS